MSTEEKKFIRSEKIGLEEAVPGMILAEAVKNDTGGVILSAEAVLSRDSIEKLKKIGINTIMIEKYVAPKEHDLLYDKKAVVIADSLFFRHMFAKMLYRFGMFVCEEIEDISRGAGCAARYNPELIVIDMDIPPGSNPGKVIKDYRKKFPYARIMAVSASKEKQQVVEAIRSGANDFMMKPVDWKVLRERLLRLFETRDDGNGSLVN